MTTTTHSKNSLPAPVPTDRPGWIPDGVGDDWDPHPYAYQTSKQLMPDRTGASRSRGTRID